jgi:type IV secretory pathway TrbD component
MQGYAGGEVSLFAAQGIQVTSARLVCGPQTYPIAAITSVNVFMAPPENSSAKVGIGLCVFGFLAALTFGTCGNMVDMRGATGTAVFLSVVAAVVMALCIRSIVASKPTYGVQIWTSGMNVRAMHTPDPSLANGVAGAINQALAMR